MYKQVRDLDHAIHWEAAKTVVNSDDYYRRLVIDFSHIRTVISYNNMQSTLAIDNCSSHFILKSKPSIIKNIW